MKVLHILTVVLNIAVVLSLEPFTFQVRQVGNSTTCNGLERRIDGGTVASESQFPYMIFVLMRHSCQRSSHCSASLIKPNWVLLAAHCVYHQNLQPEDIILVGSRANLFNYMHHRLSLDFDTPVNEELFGVQERRAKSFHYHPKYNPTVLEHDVALIELQKPFDLTSSVSTLAVSEDIITRKKNCTILGWGLIPGEVKTYILHYVEDKEVSTTEIGCLYNKTERFICTTPEVGGVCSGDSGSPLVCDGKIWGVASHFVSSDSKCGCSDEEYYTEIHADLDWMRSVYGGANLSSVISLKTVLICIIAGFLIS